MHLPYRVVFFAVAGIVGLVSCAETSQTVQPGCGQAPPSQPTLVLAYPEANAGGVPVTLGSIIFLEQGPVPPFSVMVTSSHGTLPAAGFAPPPSPLPTPIVPRNPTLPSSEIYIALPVPVLRTHTRYTVHFSQYVWADNPPECAAEESQSLGSFTTS